MYKDLPYHVVDGPSDLVATAQQRESQKGGEEEAMVDLFAEIFRREQEQQ